MKETVKLNIENWKIKQIERSRGRMKFQIKLNKQETESFKVFSETVKPEEVSQDDFVKSIFLTGIESMNQKIMSMVEDFAKENPEDFKAQLVEMQTMQELHEGEELLALQDGQDGQDIEETKGSEIEIVE